MAEALRPMARQRLYEQVLDRLRAYVADKGLRSGDQLPTERELAQRLAVSRASVKQAIVVLEVQGMLEVRHGGGMYLRRDSLDSEPVAQLLERRDRLPDVLDAREALETKLAELAAERRTADDLDAIHAALDFMEAELEHDRGIEGDRRFHAAVTAAAHSSLLAGFMASIAESITETRNESLRQPGRPKRSLAQHRRIAEAIAARQPKKAAEAMRRHVRTVAKVRLLDWDPDQDAPR